MSQNVAQDNSVQRVKTILGVTEKEQGSSRTKENNGNDFVNERTCTTNHQIFDSQKIPYSVSNPISQNHTMGEQAGLIGKKRSRPGITETGLELPKLQMISSIKQEQVPNYETETNPPTRGEKSDGIEDQSKKLAEEQLAKRRKAIEEMTLAALRNETVGKRPPKDMKRLDKKKWYKVIRVARWGDTPALLLTADDSSSRTGSDHRGIQTETEEDDGDETECDDEKTTSVDDANKSVDSEIDSGRKPAFYKPPKDFLRFEFHVGDRIKLSKVGYSRSRNLIAQSIEIDPTKDVKPSSTDDDLLQTSRVNRNNSAAVSTPGFGSSPIPLSNNLSELLQLQNGIQGVGNSNLLNIPLQIPQLHQQQGLQGFNFGMQPVNNGQMLIGQQMPMNGMQLGSLPTINNLGQTVVPVSLVNLNQLSALTNSGNGVGANFGLNNQFVTQLQNSQLLALQGLQGTNFNPTNLNTFSWQNNS